MHILRARLLERELQRRAEERARLKGEHVSPSWGTQRRSYILHPYKLVKDLRTGLESSNVQAVLDGELDDFLEETLRAAVTSP
jgi:peptide chain release factor 2